MVSERDHSLRQMNNFSIRDIANLSGIKPHTLRIWEQRYNILPPKRKKSLHRYYDNEDLKHILRVSLLYHNGLRISKIAMLSSDEIRLLATEGNAVPGQSQYINLMMEASIDFDQEWFDDITDAALHKFGVERWMTGIVYPFLEKVGLFWMTGHIIPAQEHFASNIIRDRLVMEIDRLPLAVNSPHRILLFSPQGECHELPLLFMHYLLRSRGNSVVYLGHNTPAEQAQSCLQYSPFTHACFHLITNFLEEELDDYVSQYCSAFPHIRFVVSGPATRTISVTFDNLRILRSQDDIQEFAKTTVAR